MPELPEVETVARYLRARVTDARITVVRVVPHEKWASAATAHGRQLTDIRRRGKHLLLDLDDGNTLAIHLGMTGVVDLEIAPPRMPGPNLHERLALRMRTSDGARWLLRLTDARGFGHAIVAPRTRDGEVELAALHSMGPEPLDGWTWQHLARACARRNGPIKAALLDQSVVAGIGNYLADEILYAARVHPARSANTLSTRKLRTLHEKAVAIITKAVDAGGATISDYRHPDGSSGEAQFGLLAYGREGEPCVRCGRPMSKTVVAGRGTTYCAYCQRRS